jgi:hypothetical protein
MATRALTIATALAVTLVPAVVHACPVCAGREDSGPWRGIFLAMFIFFPFALVAAVVRYIRAEERGGPHRRATVGDER